jgi:hypothetical protein
MTRDVSALDVLLVGTSSGAVLGALALCFTNPIADLFGHGSGYDWLTISVKCVVAAMISLGGLLPMIAIAVHRADLVNAATLGPCMGLAGSVMFLMGGVYRWGPPPEFMWPIFGGFMLYATTLNIVVVTVRQRLASRKRDQNHPANTA